MFLAAIFLELVEGNPGVYIPVEVLHVKYLNRREVIIE
jgi:hypothetical protein